MPVKMTDCEKRIDSPALGWLVAQVLQLKLQLTMSYRDLVVTCDADLSRQQSQRVCVVQQAFYRASRPSAKSDIGFH
jgi:hypothetical protein